MTTGRTAPAGYEIVVDGHLDDHWSQALGGLAIMRNDDGTSTLSGRVADQAQLHGVLTGLRDMGVTLLLLRPAGPPPQRVRPASRAREDGYMTHIRRFDHVGITVADIDRVTAFFVGLGLEVEGRMVIEGEFVDTVIGIADSRSEIVMLRPPGGGTALELSSFVRPEHQPGSPNAMSTELGLRNVAFEVDDLRVTLDQLAAEGYGLVGGVGEYEGMWRMAYVRGPEGIIVSLAQRIG